MRFRVQGADPKSGQEFTTVLDAIDRNDAEEQARRRGMLVSDIKPVIDLCANCDGPIGKLETPFSYNNQIVCAACYQRLVGDSLLTPDDVVESAPEAIRRAIDARHQETVGEARARMSAARSTTGPTCPSCGYQGAMKRKAKGSSLLLIFLLLLWLLPGIIYLIVYNGYIWACPKCGAKIADAT